VNFIDPTGLSGASIRTCSSTWLVDEDGIYQPGSFVNEGCSGGGFGSGGFGGHNNGPIGNGLGGLGIQPGGAVRLI